MTEAKTMDDCSAENVREDIDRPETEPPTAAGVRSAAIDEMLRLLADAERRAVVTHLADGAARAAVSDLVGCCLREVTQSDDLLTRDRLLVRLHHKHLPKLEEAGVLSYDPRSEIVRYHGHPFLEEVLAVCNRHEG